MNKVYVVGKNIAEKEEGIVWEIQGVFTNETDAVLACVEDRCFVGPIELNAPLPEETIVWPGCYYPNLENK